MGNEKPTTPKSNTAGKTLVVIAWVLIVLRGLAFTGELYNHPRGLSIEVLLSQPTPEAIGRTVGYLIGTNILAICAFILSLVAWLHKKNRNGKVATIVSIVFIAAATLLAFLPSSGDKNVDKEMLEVQKMSDEVISACLKMTTEIQKCDLASTCKPETLTDPILLSQSRLTLQKCKNILQSYEPQIKRLFNEIPQKLAQLDIGENVKQEAIVGYNKSKDKVLNDISEFFEIEYKIVATAEALMDFMKSKQGQVKYVNNQLLFDSQADANIYNSYIRDITKLAEAEIAWQKKCTDRDFSGLNNFKNR